MQDVIKDISEIDGYKTMYSYLNNEKIPSEDFDIINEDIIPEIQGKEGHEAFLSNNIVISIATDIDEDLKMEGLVREIIRHIQVMRKDAGFDVDDRIILSNDFSSDIINAIKKHNEYFMSEILCLDIVDKMENSDYNSVFEYEGNNFNIYIKKESNK